VSLHHLTTVYYTANREPPAFERKVQATLAKNAGEVSIVSVSQSPILLGTNLCVGPVGYSGHNGFRQLQIGAQHATTRCVCPAESDFLYPPEFFQFQPPRDDTFYIAQSVYLLWVRGGCVKPFVPLELRYREAACLVNRELVIDTIEQQLRGRGMWSDVVENGSSSLPYLFEGRRVEVVRFSVPLITFKTDAGMHHRGRVYPPSSYVETLHYWGHYQALAKAYCDAN